MKELMVVQSINAYPKAPVHTPVRNGMYLAIMSRNTGVGVCACTGEGYRGIIFGYVSPSKKRNKWAVAKEGAAMRSYGCNKSTLSSAVAFDWYVVGGQ